MKKGFLKKLIKSIVQSPIVRGIVKSLPGGNLLYEVGENVVGNVVNEIAKTKELIPREIKPHNWISILIQAVGIGLLLYAFFTKQISIQEVLNLLNFDITEVANTTPVIQELKDTIQ